MQLLLFLHQDSEMSILLISALLSQLQLSFQITLILLKLSQFPLIAFQSLSQLTDLPRLLLPFAFSLIQVEVFQVQTVLQSHALLRLALQLLR